MNTMIDGLTRRTTGAMGFATRGPLVRDRSAAPTYPSDFEELANSLTHGLGLALSLAGLYALADVVGKSGPTRVSVACWVYGVTLVFAYAASTVYHGWAAGRVKRALLLIDHVAIYGLIAGTYTPLAIRAMPPGPWPGWSPLSLVWGLALAGIVMKVRRADRLDDESAAPFVAMSLTAVATLRWPTAGLPPDWAPWFMAGGGFYLAGLVFFVREDRPFSHAIWHLFVMAGSACHYSVVIGCVAPLAY
jgi:hemolysin III